VVDPELFHMRRKNTSYRVGFGDLETEVSQTIKDSNYAVIVMKEKIKEM
jgi:hypothetical protein